MEGRNNKLAEKGIASLNTKPISAILFHFFYPAFCLKK
jgi:hypothetical protein